MNPNPSFLAQFHSLTIAHVPVSITKIQLPFPQSKKNSLYALPEREQQHRDTALGGVMQCSGMKLYTWSDFFLFRNLNPGPLPASHTAIAAGNPSGSQHALPAAASDGWRKFKASGVLPGGREQGKESGASKPMAICLGSTLDSLVMPGAHPMGFWFNGPGAA